MLHQAAARARAPSNRADPDCRAPVMVAWGAGVDSTALIIELAEAGEPIDMVLFADTGSEKAETYARSEEHTSDLQSLMGISSAVFCLKKKKKTQHNNTH